MRPPTDALPTDAPPTGSGVTVASADDDPAAEPGSSEAVADEPEAAPGSDAGSAVVHSSSSTSADRQRAGGKGPRGRGTGKGRSGKPYDAADFAHLPVPDELLKFNALLRREGGAEARQAGGQGALRPRPARGRRRDREGPRREEGA